MKSIFVLFEKDGNDDDDDNINGFSTVQKKEIAKKVATRLIETFI